MTSPIDKLVHALGKLPGVGERTATRLAFFLLRAPKQIAKDLSEALKELHDKVKLCSVCCNIADKDPCRFCSGGRRDQNLICVVEEPSDVSAIEKTGAFRGVYHVLHGALSPLDGIGPEDLKVQELLNRLKDSHPKEIILATNANVEGDATSLYLARLLKPLGVRITRLASGIPVGGELEYLDASTLSKALEDRREMN
ncbi:MAG: recombination protein RecR [Deltaproteobacteria bacterium RIFCSPLOWO2_01_44_7]|nr:MAG: recombination protein RecR [Deltaproteobacteria bacterium RIFCSPHIGHO2_01_FULL_43_49]OGQ14521.1 MAG: recombination protein RecR [Deltaproteobacteria bacterium RIFCSPHIGHO2_02_FULL_44_53]OGQ27907.1 MAG: recombination protein RecR [Deltaproteobacteria bacterium RIFCSPHIGHO2_12_FULL_44_21]OGQ31119.1 MAG: recombination protein RecR [Deltaproteobacteria bacterium RIFCSPLOWO2_01_FULL_45_74]OGQ38213.1 MAG: recombination protein RecR [Deltaproteobacteria bacterium RIFCSPLOWO2_01_44_7]OGQ43110.